MNIFAVVGAHRKGNTYNYVKKLEESMKTIGDFNFDYLNLWEKQFETCRGCHLCLLRGIEKCPIKDEIIDIKEKMKQADSLILASPVYVMNVTPLMKNFIDRLSSVCHRPEFIKQNGLVLTTVGAYGSKKVLNYMENVLNVWGIQDVTKVDIQTPPVQNLPEKLQKNNKKQIENKSAIYAKKLIKKNGLKPSFSSLMQFHVQRMIFSQKTSKKDMPEDYNFYSKLEGKKYYSDIKINFLKTIAAKSIAKIMGLFY
jgi:multimeric flavodoxin WrbA